VSALRQGANDYVVLPVLPTELEARINMQVRLGAQMMGTPACRYPSSVNLSPSPSITRSPHHQPL